MAGHHPLFRKAALDKLSSPERLDVLMRVTSPMGWLALLTIAGILAGVVAWSVFGTIPDRIDGQGILLRGGGVLEIKATTAGTLAALELKLDDVVRIDQIIGQIKLEAVRAPDSRLPEMTSGAEQAPVSSRVAGRVIEIRKGVGDSLQAGDAIAAIEPVGTEIQVVAFVSADVAKRISPPMPAEISPTNVKREEYGFMLGQVRIVGDFAASPQYVQNTLRNDAVVKQMLGSGPVTEVRATLRDRAETPSGFAWSTSAGPPFKIESGTLVKVAIIVDRKQPITLVMPFLRKTLGVA